MLYCTTPGSSMMKWHKRIMKFWSAPPMDSHSIAITKPSIPCVTQPTHALYVYADHRHQIHMSAHSLVFSLVPGFHLVHSSYHKHGKSTLAPSLHWITKRNFTPSLVELTIKLWIPKLNTNVLEKANDPNRWNDMVYEPGVIGYHQDMPY